MSKTKLFIALLTAVIAIVGVCSALPPESRTQPAHASQTITECPPPTSEGSYFERGIGKDGNVICGFQYNNECPYAAGYSATDPMCDKFKQQQEPKQPVAVPEQPKAVTDTCEGK